MFYLHLNRLIDDHRTYSQNTLKVFDSTDDLYLYVRGLIFDTEFEDETDYMNLKPIDLFEDIYIEISIFDNNMVNVFNFGKSHDQTWLDFENFCFGKNEKKIMIKSYKLFTESKKPKFPDIKKFEYNGFIIYMGRDAKSNDYLTFNIADREDIWMHVKGVPGSHVVVRVRENLPTDDVIRFAAEIAKKNSKSKGSQSSPIVYCQRKFVKKEPGMNDGQVKVDYINAYEINI